MVLGSCLRTRSSTSSAPLFSRKAPPSPPPSPPPWYTPPSARSTLTGTASSPSTSSLRPSNLASSSFHLPRQVLHLYSVGAHKMNKKEKKKEKQNKQHHQALVIILFKIVLLKE